MLKKTNLFSLQDLISARYASDEKTKKISFVKRNQRDMFEIYY